MVLIFQGVLFDGFYCFLCKKPYHSVLRIMVYGLWWMPVDTAAVQADPIFPLSCPIASIDSCPREKYMSFL